MPELKFFNPNNKPDRNDLSSLRAERERLEDLVQEGKARFVGELSNIECSVLKRISVFDCNRAIQPCWQEVYKERERCG